MIEPESEKVQAPKRSGDEVMKLRFVNPVTNKTEYACISKDKLDAIRRFTEGEIFVVSFFQNWKGKSYAVHLNLDTSYKVRQASKSRFFLRDRKGALDDLIQ